MVFLDEMPFAAFRGAVRSHPDPQAPAMRPLGVPQFHASTARRIEHPCCDRRHNAGHDNVDKLALLTVLAVVQPQKTTEVGMPAMVEDNFLPASDRSSADGYVTENPRNNISELATWSMISFVNTVTGYPTARICWRLLGSSPCSTPYG